MTFQEIDSLGTDGPESDTYFWWNILLVFGSWRSGGLDLDLGLATRGLVNITTSNSNAIKNLLLPAIFRMFAIKSWTIVDFILPYLHEPD